MMLASIRAKWWRGLRRLGRFGWTSRSERVRKVVEAKLWRSRRGRIDEITEIGLQTGKISESP